MNLLAIVLDKLVGCWFKLTEVGTPDSYDERHNVTNRRG